jgi:predicted aldo/keto reductase-like oxidoreductase
MKYKYVPKTNWQLSALAFGCMRFKNEESAVAAVRKAISLGVNYFDVAPAYGRGTAEAYLGKGLAGLRDKVIVTAKSSPGNGGVELGEYQPERGFGIRTADQVRRQIERSMQILGVDHLDMYQLWSCHSPEVFKGAIIPGGFLDGVLKAKEEGLVDYIGLTTHSPAADIIRYLQESPYEFDMLTIQFNPINTEQRPILEYCEKRGIGVLAMNPLAGGRLARPAPILQRIAEEAGCASMVEAALRYVAWQSDLMAALNGITYADHAAQGAAAVEKGPLSPENEEKLIAGLSELYRSIDLRHLCTGCRYCGECPQGIHIPEVLELFTNLRIPSLAAEARKGLAEKSAAGVSGYDPAACVACGQCEQKCPNKLPVSQLMAAAAGLAPCAGSAS